MVAQGQAAHQHEFPSSISPVNTLYWTFAGIRRPSGRSPLSISFFICLVSNHYTFCRWTLILISNIKFRESCPIACARAPIKSSAFCNRNIFVAFMVGCQFWLLSPPRRGWGSGRDGRGCNDPLFLAWSKCIKFSFPARRSGGEPLNRENVTPPCRISH